MREAGRGEPGRSEGIAIAREMLAAVKDRVAGAYVMPPFGRHETGAASDRGHREVTPFLSASPPPTYPCPCPYDRISAWLLLALTLALALGACGGANCPAQRITDPARALAALRATAHPFAACAPRPSSISAGSKAASRAA